MSKIRVICWFSAGAASAVAAKLAIEKYGADKRYEVIVAQIYLANEHPDSKRFTAECAKWFGRDIQLLSDTTYGADINEVFRKKRYMAGINGASCTTQLKRNVRQRYQRDTDIHVFGMTCEETDRVDKLGDNEEGLILDAVLVTAGLTKTDCFRILTEEAGIVLPAMYQLGYPNNNCIGCVKSGSPTYWNKIRQDFPEEYARRSAQELDLGVSLCTVSRNVLRKEFPETLEAIEHEEQLRGINIAKTNKKGRMRIPLRHLPPELGKGREIKLDACGLFCDATESRKQLLG